MKTQAYFFEHGSARGQTCELEQDSGVLKCTGIPGAEGRTFSFSEIDLQKLPGAEKWKLKIRAQEMGFLIEDKIWIEHLISAVPEYRHKGNRLGMPFPWLRIALIFVFAAAGILYGLYKATPWIADQAAVSLPWEWEMQLGDKIAAELIQKEQIDQQKTEVIREFYGLTMALPEEGHPSLPIEITVVKNDEFNAFAIPGRKIVIYTGALEAMNSHEELLAILGHEAGHVAGRHSLRTLFRALSAYAVVSFIAGDVTGVMAILIQNAQNIQQMSYSRDFEREADVRSHEYLCANKANPEGLVRLMKALQKKYGALENKDFSFFNSHPLTGERIENARKQIQENPCSGYAGDEKLANLFARLKKTSW